MNPLRALLDKARWLIEPGESLGRRAANAGSWAFALNMTNRLMTIVRAGVLANLLAREDFGLMGIAMLVIGLVTSFTQTGFTSALVQNKRGLERNFLDTAWTVEAGRGLVLAGVMVAAAPLVGSFFDAPEATDLTRLLALGLAMTGFVNPGVISFDKDLEFQRRFVFRATPNAIDLIVSVVLALVLGNAWALAWGWVAGRAGAVAASYVAHPHRPRLRFDHLAARAMFGFGIWTLASQFLLYFTFNIDDIMVGRLIDADALGLYQMAFTMSQLTTTEITTVVNQVAFPAYARLQDAPVRLGSAYERTLQLVAVASFPVAGGLWFVGPEAIQTFLGDKWVPMVPAFNILLVWGLIRSILATTGPLFRGVGRPSIATRIQAGQLLLLAALIYPMTLSFGVEGAAWATVLAAIVPGAFAIGLASRVSTAPMRAILKVTAFPIFHSAIMLACLVALESTGVMPEGGWLLVWGPIVGAAVYLAATLVSRRWFGYLAGGLLPSSRNES